MDKGLLGALERMHKVVLEVKDEAELEKVAAKLVRLEQRLDGVDVHHRIKTTSHTISGSNNPKVTRPALRPSPT